MKRAIPAALATAAALAALLGYKSGTPVKRTSATPVPTASPVDGASASASTTAPITRTVSGSVVRTKYGDVQVQATVQSGRLIDVAALQLPFDHQKSQVISDRAAPVLRAEALQAQSARIDTVSGATYTSDAYAQSLQAALDAARAAS